ncbi:hypothetical protein TK5_09440 [Sideroxyarcus sp. TK5]
MTMYETAKANGANTLSSKIFDELNPMLSEEWEAVKVTLKIYRLFQRNYRTPAG